MPKLIQILEGAASDVETFVTSDVFPFLEEFFSHLVTDAVAAAKPIVEAKLALIVQDIGALNDPKSWGAIIITAVPDLLTELATAEIQVTYTDLHVAILAVLNNMLSAFNSNTGTVSTGTAAATNTASGTVSNSGIVSAS